MLEVGTNYGINIIIRLQNIIIKFRILFFSYKEILRS